ncbi:MAG: glycosyltransferase family 4 protein, partial [Chloroflexi bacterium]
MTHKLGSSSSADKCSSSPSHSSPSRSLRLISNCWWWRVNSAIATCVKPPSVWISNSKALSTLVLPGGYSGTRLRSFTGCAFCATTNAAGSSSPHLPRETNVLLRFEPRADLRILILNWRCPTNPQAGGAEFVTFEIARRLVQFGNSVEWFSATFPGAPSEETLEGVHIVRGGRQWTVHWSAFRHYRGNTSKNFDVVVDEVNTIPFFTPLWAGIPVVMLIHQLAREVWWYEAPFPLNTVGFLAEPI